MTLDADACWKALSARDARFDGRFYVGVATTGIYCRPVCNVRMPRRENCRFFASAAAAESRGFRWVEVDYDELRGLAPGDLRLF